MHGHTYTLKLHTGIYIQHGYCYILHHLTIFFLLSHHPQQEPQYSLFVLISVPELCPLLVLHRHTCYRLPFLMPPRTDDYKIIWIFKISLSSDNGRHTYWRNNWRNVTPVLCTRRWSHFIWRKNQGGTVTVTVSLSCVSVTEAPGNVYLTIKYGTSESIQNKIKIERKKWIGKRLYSS